MLFQALPSSPKSLQEVLCSAERSQRYGPDHALLIPGISKVVRGDADLLVVNLKGGFAQNRQAGISMLSGIENHRKEGVPARANPVYAPFYSIDYVSTARNDLHVAVSGDQDN